MAYLQKGEIEIKLPKDLEHIRAVFIKIKKQWVALNFSYRYDAGVPEGVPEKYTIIEKSIFFNRVPLKRYQIKIVYCAIKQA